VGVNGIGSSQEIVKVMFMRIQWHRIQPRNSKGDVHEDGRAWKMPQVSYQETIQLTAQFIVFASRKSTCYLVTNEKVKILLSRRRR
jgi:hypothetical protein